MQKELNSILYGFQHWIFIDFGLIWEVFFHDFWSAFRVSSKRERSHSFSNIFQRFSYFVASAKSLKSIVKMGGFWTIAFVIHIMRRSKTSLKNLIKTMLKSLKICKKKRFRIKHPVGLPFCSHFGMILAPFWTDIGPDIAQNRFRTPKNRSRDASRKSVCFWIRFEGARSWGNRGGMVVIPGVWAPLIH